MPQPSHADALEIELIRSLFESKAPALIMSAGFLATGSLAVWQTGDWILAFLLAAGIVTSIGRITLMAMRCPEARAPGLALERARQLQQRFTLSYFGFAMVLGMFGERVMQLHSPELHMLTICMLVGYGAGVAAGIGLRPRIAIPCMIVATVPAITAALSRADIVYWTMAVLTSGFLVGGVKSVTSRHARAVRSIGRRITFSALARQDGLTALPNRLALREWFDERVACADQPGMVAVHYLDLNGFKPVNDRYGHPVGDALLVAVSGRIARTIRTNDMAARFGGDEFAVVQCGIASADEAALLAQRLATAIGKPYQIEDNMIRISTCVGYIVSERGEEDLEYLLGAADDALYTSKRGGGGVTRWQPSCALEARAAA
jgi:diguanylate cyclase (GGDEF)-like protein